MNHYIIGISGRAGHGKDTVARLLAGHPAFDGGTTLKHFAYPIKKIAHILFGFSWKDMNSEEGKKKPGAYGLTIREILQKIGTEMFRDLINPEIWVDYMDRKVKESRHPIIMVPDLRFANEEKWVRDMGGIIVKVVRDGGDRIESASHVSETYIDLIKEDFLVKNDGSLEDLLAEIEGPLFEGICDELADRGFFNT